MTHNEMIEVIAAHRDRKMIQFRVKGVGVQWCDCDTNKDSWDFNQWDYRIKPPEPPKPREWWVFQRNSSLLGAEWVALQQRPFVDAEVIHVREVIE